MKFLHCRIRRRATWMRCMTVAILALTLCEGAPAAAAEFYFKASGNTATFYLDAGRGAAYGGNLNGKFDTVDFQLTTFNGSFININSGQVGGIPRPPGEPSTYRNRVLDADPLDGGLGWSVVGQVINANGMAWAGGPLGHTIDTSGQPNGGLFLANVQFGVPARTASVSGRVQLISAGDIVAEIPFVPEPAAGVLGLFAALAVRGVRSRAIRSSRAKLG